MQLKYGLLDKAPKSEDIMFITSLWLMIRSANVFLPPLHIKLGLMKNFVKAMNQEGDGFKFLKDFFGAHKSDAKLKAGIFVGPEIRKLMLNEEFDSRLNPVELAAWNALKSVVVTSWKITVINIMLMQLMTC